MRTPSRVLLGLAAAAVVAGGGSAFTAANNVTAVDNEYLGYGAVNVTGVTVTNVAYNVSGTNSNALTDVTFTATQDVSGTGYKAVMTLNGTSGSQITCTRTFTTSTAISCPTTAAVDSVTSVHLTVSPL